MTDMKTAIENAISALNRAADKAQRGDAPTAAEAALYADARDQLVAVSLRLDRETDAPLLDLKEAADYLRKSPVTVRRYVADGTLRAHYIGEGGPGRSAKGEPRKGLYFKRVDLDALLVPIVPSDAAAVAEKRAAYTTTTTENKEQP